MPSRRRKGNPLLVRIVVISLLVHILVLPILAYFGAFKKIGFGSKRVVDVVMLASVPKVKEPEVKRKAKQPAKATTKGPGKKSAPSKGTPLNQRVVASNSPAGTGGSGPSIVNPDKGAAPGTLPTAPPPNPTKTSSSGGGATTPRETPPTTKPVVAPAPTPAPATTPVVKPHVPVLTEADTTYNPSPVIPDDLRTAALDATVTAEFIVSPQGTPTSVKISKSSGNDELDNLALETARKWRFKPATRDGQPVESRVLLHIEFEVQS